MARNRQIYQTSLVYILTGSSATGKHFSQAIIGFPGSGIGTSAPGLGPTGNWIAELYRVQSFSDDWSTQLTDVNQFGELAAIDRVSLAPPVVNVSMNYLLSNLVNERLLGLTVTPFGSIGAAATLTSCISGILSNTTDSFNVFCKIVPEGSDAIESNTAYDVRAFGNCFLNSYTVQGQVGQFPTVDVTLTALNAVGNTFTSITGWNYIPAVNPTDGTVITSLSYGLPTGFTSYPTNLGVGTGTAISVLRPKDITLSLGITDGDGFAKELDMKAQSFNLSFNMNREDLNKLGSKYAFAKVPQFPLQATLSVNAILGDNQTGNLSYIVDTNRTFNPSITIAAPDSSTQIAYFKLAGAKLQSQNFAQSIGQNQTVAFTFQAQIGGPQDTANGVFMSGMTA